MSPIILPRPLQRALLLVEEAFFPRLCGVCRAEGSFLCPSCALNLSNSMRQTQSCGHCGVRETPLGVLCFDCVGSAAHDGIFAALRYHHPEVARLIHLFKYRFVQDLGNPLGAHLARALLQSEIPLPDAIFPVPLHPRRERWRGWNQSEILAESLQKNLPEELSPPIIKTLLIRTRFTAPQMSIHDKKLREKNIAGAFHIIAPKNSGKTHSFDITGKRVWIVDDVAASGSTISACAHALKRRGAREVFGIVVAR